MCVCFTELLVNSLWLFLLCQQFCINKKVFTYARDTLSFFIVQIEQLFTT